MTVSIYTGCQAWGFSSRGSYTLSMARKQQTQRTWMDCSGFEHEHFTANNMEWTMEGSESKTPESYHDWDRSKYFRMPDTATQLGWYNQNKVTIKKTSNHKHSFTPDFSLQHSCKYPLQWSRFSLEGWLYGAYACIWTRDSFWHAVSSADECYWDVDFLTNFSLTAERKKKTM